MRMPSEFQQAAQRCRWRCVLALEDGTVFEGTGFGARGTRTGEVVFNTSMTGYQEVLTDPSYCGQIVTMTYPHIGNYGVSRDDFESDRVYVAGFVVRELARAHSSYRATGSLEDFLAHYGVIGIEGIDTRALAKKLRVDGAMRGIVSTEIDDPAECVRTAARAPTMSGTDLVKLVAPTETGTWTQGVYGEFTPARGCRPESRTVVAIDCGMKRNILRHLVDIGAAVYIVPPASSPAEVFGYRPDGVFVSNGPGDPAAVHYAVELLKGLVDKVPIFGICLGHQLLGLSLGAKTFKLKFGHRGANQPVQSLASGGVEITAQNHGFAIETRSLESAGGAPTHINLNDRTLEGFVHRTMPILAVQYHPEASPGPHDAAYLFDCFATMMSTGRALTGEEIAAAQDARRNRAWLAR